MSAKIRPRPNWLDSATTAENEILPRYAKWAWSSRGISLALNVVLMMQVTYYCTDMLGLSPMLTGVLLLASKVFDGFTDLVVGFIIDKTHTRFGKARPYEIFIVLVWIFTVLLYSTPEIGTVGKAVYVFILYSLIFSVCSTFLNGVDAIYLARSFRSEKNRVSVMSFNGALVMLGSIVVGIILPQLVKGLGTTKQGWVMIALLFAVPLGVIGIFRFLFIKEVAIEEKPQSVQQKIGFAKTIRCVFSNKYIFLLAGITLAVQMISGIGSSVGTYYFKYIVGDVGLGSVVALGTLATPIMLMLFPALCKKLGKVGILRAGVAAAVVGVVIRIFGGTNLLTLTFGSLLCTLGILPATMMISLYLIDCMDYGEWKNGVRVEGVLTAANSFANKIGNGIASGVVGLVTGLAGYDGMLEVQSASANTAIIGLYNFLPLVLLVITLILSLIYDLDKHLPKVKQDLANRKEQ